MRARSVLATVGITAALLTGTAGAAGAVVLNQPDGTTCTGNPTVTCSTTSTVDQVISQVTRPTGKFTVCGNWQAYDAWVYQTFYNNEPWGPGAAAFFRQYGIGKLAAETMTITTVRHTTTTTYSKYIAVPLPNHQTYQVPVTAPLPTSTSTTTSSSSPLMSGWSLCSSPIDYAFGFGLTQTAAQQLLASATPVGGVPALPWGI
jgi:hypothetical protein